MKNILKLAVDYAKELLTYRQNVLQFINDHIKIPLPGGSTPIKLYNKQEELIRNFLKYHYLAILKTRQIGISTVVQALVASLCCCFDNFIVGVISRDGGEATDFARKVRTMIEEIPLKYRPEFDKKTEQSFILDNGSALYVGIVNPARPGAVFRGKAITLLVIDEAAYIDHIDPAYTAIIAALLKAHSIAKERQIPYGCIIMSTPNGTTGTGQWFHQFWNYVNDNNSIYYPMKIHWKDIPEFANNTEWYETQCALYHYDKYKIAQELDLAFISGENAVIDEELSLILQENIREADKIYDVKDNHKKVGELWLWNYDTAHSSIFIGVDPATQYGMSNSAIQIIDINTMEQIGEFRGKCEVTVLQTLLDEIIMPMFPNAVLVIENNSIGNQLVEYFVRSKWKSNLYYSEVLDQKKQRRYMKPGLTNTNAVRPLIMDSLLECINDYAYGVKSERLVNELLGLKRGRNDKIQGSPDDLCLAYGFIAYLRQHNKITFTPVGLHDESVNVLNDIIDENNYLTRIYQSALYPSMYRDVDISDMSHMFRFSADM